jgi:hypothetical protein
MNDLAIQFCEEQVTKGADFDTTMSDLVRGGNPTADAFIAWMNDHFVRLNNIARREADFLRVAKKS